MLHAVVLLLAVAQDPPILAGTLREQPAGPGRGPTFTCEGTAALPDDVELYACLHYGAPNPGSEFVRAFPRVKGGKFSCELTLFPDRTLPGRWTARVTFDPNLQRPEHRRLLRAVLLAPLDLGTPAEAETARVGTRKSLAGEIHAIRDLGRGIGQALDASPPPADWPARIDGLKSELGLILRRAKPSARPDYLVLGFSSAAGDGLIELGRRVLNASAFAAAGKPVEARMVLERLEQESVNLVAGLGSLHGPAEIVILLDEVRGKLREAAAAPDAALAPSRKRFHEIIQILDTAFPKERHAEVIDLAARGTAFFRAAADRDGSAPRLLSELDAALLKFAAPPSK